MLDWLIAGWVTAAVLYFFGMFATRNMVKALKNDLFGDGSVEDVVTALLILLLWPFAQIIATFYARGPDKPH